MGTVVSMPDDCPALIVVILPAAKCMLETFHRDARAHPVCVSSHTKNLPGPSWGPRRPRKSNSSFQNSRIRRFTKASALGLRDVLSHAQCACPVSESCVRRAHPSCMKNVASSPCVLQNSWLPGRKKATIGAPHLTYLGYSTQRRATNNEPPTTNPRARTAPGLVLGSRISKTHFS